MEMEGGVLWTLGPAAGCRADAGRKPAVRVAALRSGWDGAFACVWRVGCQV